MLYQELNDSKTSESIFTVNEHPLKQPLRLTLTILSVLLLLESLWMQILIVIFIPQIYNDLALPFLGAVFQFFYAGMLIFYLLNSDQKFFAPLCSLGAVMLMFTASGRILWLTRSGMYFENAVINFIVICLFPIVIEFASIIIPVVLIKIIE